MRDQIFDKTALDINFYRDWVAKREEALTKKGDKKTFFVTVSREFGCNGYDMAVKLVEKINATALSPWTLCPMLCVNLSMNMA